MLQVGNAQYLGKRENQEDYFATRQIKNGILCIVADGMGGYEGGEVASVASVKNFISFFKDHFDILTLTQNLFQSLEYANESIRGAKEENDHLVEMGTTFVALFITEDELSWVSVGDSILYRHRQGQLVRLNEDHSRAGELQKEVYAGKITQKEADASDDRHMLTSALSGYDIPHIDLRQEPLDVEDGDIYLLTTDGIHTLSDRKIESIISKISDPPILADVLIEEVENRDSPHQDNTSIVVLKMTKAAQKEEDAAEKPVDNKKNQPVIISSFIILSIVALSVGTYLYFQDPTPLMSTIDQNSSLESNTTEVNVSTGQIIEENQSIMPFAPPKAIDINAANDLNETFSIAKSQEINVSHPGSATLDANQTIEHNVSKK